MTLQVEEGLSFSKMLKLLGLPLSPPFPRYVTKVGALFEIEEDDLEENTVYEAVYKFSRRN